MLSEKINLEKTPMKVYRHSRPKFHAMLLRQLSRIGIEVQYGKEVAEYSENLEKGRAGVLFKDGSRQEADIVIAADGLRSASQDLIASHPVPARSSGAAMFRAAFPVEYALADPMVAERFKLMDDGRSVIEMWSGHVPTTHVV
jgi:2-polyprenyl-6-methoxyphenol hydroxylase-like FAD-dependent oxidoreductase